MNSINLSYDHAAFLSKPTTEDAARISKRIGRFKTQLTPAELHAFVRDVSLDGRTFCPATFKNGKRSKESFEQQQLFALDFDGGISLKDVVVRAERYDLPVLFAYDTFSSQNHDKFRAVFLNDASVPDRRVAEAILKALTTVFPEADPSCRDISHMYYGGKELLHFDEAIPTVNIESVFRNLTNYLEDRHGATNYKREIEKFSGATGIALNGKRQLDVSVTEVPAETVGASLGDKNLQNPSMIYRIGKKLSRRYIVAFNDNGTKNLSDQPKVNDRRPYPAGALGDVRSGCRLYREFEDGSRRLCHNELFGLVTNLVHVSSGAKRFKETLSTHGYYADRPERYRKWEQDLRYIKSSQSCAGFCPYNKECVHGTNILSSVKVGYHRLERLVNYSEQYVSAAEAEDDFKDSLGKAIQSGYSGWHVIKAQTALGKTQAYLELRLSQLQRNLFCN
jgi:hypothetical protein